MTDWEAKLDARLRQVPLPLGLVARLRSIADQDPSLSDEELAILSDDAVDERLCAVELPPSLLERLQHEVASAALGEKIDRQLADVVVPRSLLKDLRQIPWQLTHRPRVQRLAMAAALLVMTSVAYYGALAFWLASFRPGEPAQLAWIELDQRPVSVEGGIAEAVVDSDPGSGRLVEITQTTIADDAAVSTMLVSASALPEESTPMVATGATHDVNTQFATSRPWQDLLILRWGVLGSPSDVSDRLPPLESLPHRRDIGILRPLVRGYDSEFLFKHGVPPMVSADGHAELRSVAIPLTTSVDSYRLAWQRLREGRWPDADEMHIADFIAAMEYPLPATKPGEVGLRTAAGPSPFGRDGARMLQICVQAGPLADAQRRPVHLTIALDVSASMNLGGKLDTAKQSIRRMLGHLGSRDTVSLLLFNDHEQAEIAAIGREETATVLGLIDSLSGTGGTNIAAGIQRGASLAMSDGFTGAKRKFVLITDGRAPLPDQTHQALGELMTELKREGLDWSILDLSTDDQPDPDLQRLAKSSSGALSHVGSGSEAEWMLSDLLVGGATLIAPDAQVSVTFDPKAVAAYRLIGHEPAILSGGGDAMVQLDLRAGQVATGMLEVWLKPNSHDEVATAKLSWNDAKTGERRETTQPISRLQFVPTFAEAPLSLQAGILAAETGEILKQSPFAESRNRGLAEVRSLSFKVNPRLANREGFRKFVSFVEAAERLRTQRITPK